MHKNKIVANSFLKVYDNNIKIIVVKISKILDYIYITHLNNLTYKISENEIEKFRDLTSSENSEKEVVFSSIIQQNEDNNKKSKENQINSQLNGEDIQTNNINKQEFDSN